MKLKKRVVVVLFYKDKQIVQSYNFSNFKVVGNSIYTVKRVNQWDLDELVFLDLSTDESNKFFRRDIPQALNLSFQDAIKSMSSTTHAPLAVGGRIKSLSQVQEYLNHGADKIVINSALFENTDLVEKIVTTFGSQVLVAAVDYKREEVPRVYKHGGREKTEWDVRNWLQKLEEMGVGEILLNSIDKDGMKTGYDIDIVSDIPEDLKIPIILLGGAGEYYHFKEALQLDKVHSVAAGNFFLHEDQSYFNLKKQLIDQKINVRKSELYLEKLKKDAILQ